MQKLKCWRIITDMRGFTLIELMIVMAIISIMASLLIPQFSTSIARAKDVKLKADLATLDSAIMMYYVDKGVYPKDLTTLVEESYFGGSSSLKDALGNDFIYTPSTNSYILTGKNSAGKDVASPGSKT